MLKVLRKVLTHCVDSFVTKQTIKVKFMKKPPDVTADSFFKINVNVNEEAKRQVMWNIV